MINLILSDTKRSLTYLKHILPYFKKDIDVIIFYGVKKKFIILRLIKIFDINNKVFILKSKDINNIKIEDYLSNKKYYNIISSYPGEIITKEALLSKKLIHAHPGDLPMFRGSTTIYYNIILKKEVCVSIIEMSRKIDEGRILHKKKFKIPKKKILIEKDFDNIIRAKSLVSYLKLRVKKKPKTQKILPQAMPYYIAHPIIRQIVFNKKILQKTNLFDTQSLLVL